MSITFQNLILILLKIVCVSIVFSCKQIYLLTSHVIVKYTIYFARLFTSDFLSSLYIHG